MASKIEFEIRRSDLFKLSSRRFAGITDVENLSSYNWIEADESTPTISVPGSPPMWTAPPGGMQLQQDYGLVYVNQNGARHPQFPLEPLFRALFTTQPEYDISSVDVVTDRSNLTKLLSFKRPSMNREKIRAFAIEAELVKDTLILNRYEGHNTEIIRPDEFRGFGRQYKDTYTTSLIRNSTGHHRIISYNFGGLKMIVRHEADGYIEEDRQQQFNAEGMARAFTMWKGKEVPVLTMPNSPLHVRIQGQAVSIASTVEIKTKSKSQPFRDHEIMPQLWTAQTPYLVRAYHKWGWFDEPKVEDMCVAVGHWEEDNQDLLRPLAGLLKEIKALVKKCGGKAFINFGGSESDLCIREAKRDDMLPEELYLKWGTKEQSKSPIVDEDQIPVVHSSKAPSVVVSKSSKPQRAFC